MKPKIFKSVVDDKKWTIFHPKYMLTSAPMRHFNSWADAMAELERLEVSDWKLDLGSKKQIYSRIDRYWGV